MEWPDYDPSSSSCRQNFTFFDSSQYLILAFHCTAILNLPFSLLTFYVVLRKTPQRMRNMKGPLLMSHFLCANLDAMLTILFCPYPFFPSAAGLPLGLLSDWGVPVKWQAYWCQVSILMIGVSIIISYENRQSQIITIHFKIKSSRMRVLYFGANFVIVFLIMIPFHLESSDQLEMRRAVLQMIPCPTIEFFDKSTYVLLKDGGALQAFSIFGSTAIIASQAFFFIFHTTYHLSFIANVSISDGTRALQKRYMTYVSVQILIPMLGLVFPVAYSLYAFNFNVYNQSHNNHAMVVMANHGLLSSLATLFIYKPYRDFCTRIMPLRKHLEKRDSITFEVVPRMASISR